MCTTHILPPSSLWLAPLVIAICLVDTVITQWIHLCDSVARDLLSNSYLYTLKTTDFLVLLSSFWPDCNSKHKVFASGAVEWLLSMFSRSSWISTSPIKMEWVKSVLSICLYSTVCMCWEIGGVGFYQGCGWDLMAWVANSMPPYKKNEKLKGCLYWFLTARLLTSDYRFHAFCCICCLQYENCAEIF